MTKRADKQSKVYALIFLTAIVLIFANSVYAADNSRAQGSRPYLLLTDTRLAELRAKACYDENGNTIPGCTPTSDWTRFKSFVDGGGYGKSAWHEALAYMVTQQTSYADQAISEAMSKAGSMSSVRFDSYLDAGYTIRGVALVYDWLYDRLSSSQRTTLMNYFSQTMVEIWNNSSNPYNTWSGWGVNDPQNNYYYNFLTATCYAGIATMGETLPNPPTMPFRGTDYTDILDFLLAKLDEQAVPEYISTLAEGGYWHEGVNYRQVSVSHMFEVFTALKDAGIKDYYSLLSFPTDHVNYQLYVLQPDGQRQYPGGDLARESSMSLCTYDIKLILMAVDGISGRTAEYGQYFANHTNLDPSFDWARGSANIFLYHQPDYPERDYRELDTAYYAPGVGWFNSRSSWDSDAVSVSFISTARIQSHSHFDANSFVIFKEDWLAVDQVTYSSSGIDQATKYHNTILVDGSGQGYGDAGEVVKFESGNNNAYAYVVGDASKAYGSRLNTFLRELVHVKPDFVVIYDRITPSSSSSNIEYMLQVRNTPTIQSNLVIAENNGGKLFQRTLLPENPSFNTASNIRTTVEITPPSNTARREFLHVLYATTSSVSSMPNVEHITARSDNMTGAKLDMGAEDAVILFSNDPEGNTPEGQVIYEVGMNSTGPHYLCNLEPNTSYSVAFIERDTERVVIVERGDGYKTTGAGILVFDIQSVEENSEDVAAKN